MTNKKDKWDKKKEELYDYNCFEEYDEEYCMDTVYRFDDSDFDYGEDEEERYI